MFYIASHVLTRRLIRRLIMDNWDRWLCRICEHIYDPCTGDPQHGVEAGTPFSNLPRDWVCPDCGAAKTNFRPCHVYTDEMY